MSVLLRRTVSDGVSKAPWNDNFKSSAASIDDNKRNNHYHHHHHRRSHRQNDKNDDESPTTPRKAAAATSSNPTVAAATTGHGPVDHVTTTVATSTKTLAQNETRVVSILRVAVVGVLFIASIVVSTFVYLYLKKQQQQNFHTNFQHVGKQVLSTFHSVVSKNIASIGTLSTYITSYAHITNSTFPFVTIPSFELHGNNLRITSSSHIIYYLPLVTDETRIEWEIYAMKHRYQATNSYNKEEYYRQQQNMEFNLQQYLEGGVGVTSQDIDDDDDEEEELDNNNGSRRQRRRRRKLTTATTEEDEEEDVVAAEPEPTMLDDGTSYHPSIWSSGARERRGDYPYHENNGTSSSSNETQMKMMMYLPIWQQSPTWPMAQFYLNLDGGRLQVTHPNMIQIMTTEAKALLNQVSTSRPQSKPYHAQILSLGQYRDVGNVTTELLDDINTYLSYPVFDTFDADIVDNSNNDTDDDNNNSKRQQQRSQRNVVGVIGSNVYWKILFSNLLPSNVEGIVCVVSNSLNQTFAYRIDGPKATFLGLIEDAGNGVDYDDDNVVTLPYHDTKYDDMVLSANVNDYLKQLDGIENRAFQSVPLSDTIQYTMKVYPSKDFEAPYITYQPILYSAVTFLSFVFATTLFLVYSCVVERRQRIMTTKVIENATKAAETERELNEFLSHEIRNPLSAAITACSFVSMAVNEQRPQQDEKDKKDEQMASPVLVKDHETLKNVREDVEVVSSSLHFINDFLRSMLDIYRSSEIKVKLAPTDIKKDIFEPTSSVLHKRTSNYDFIVDCPDNLVVMTDPIRLKQVVLNLVRNATKFVERGFLRLRADVFGSTQHVRIYIEDSGPGISPQKQQELFTKYQESLDTLCQGTGIGLNLSKKLMLIMNGDLWLDSRYNSGVGGCPGSCFVIDLKTSPLELSEALNQSIYSRLGDNKTKQILHTALQGNVTGVDDGNTTEVDSSYDSKLIYNPPSQDIEQGSLTTKLVGGHKSSQPSSELPEALSVLIVDDDALLRKLVVRGIKRVAPSSWVVKDVSSGELALRLCETETFDLIFMDQYMASIDKQLLGTETCQALRQRGVTTNTTKICGLSANDLRDAFLKSGADDFILKPMPCKPNELKETLLSLLNRTE